MLNLNKNENKKKRSLIIGLDGAGKSHFAEEYCKDNGINAVVFDFNKTNFESDNIVELKLNLPAFRLLDNIKGIIDDVKKSKDFNGVVFDDVGVLFEFLTGKGKGLSKYSERAEYWKELRKVILNTDLHFIFIGQIDTDIQVEKKDEGDKVVKPSKILVQLHSLVDEKYLCEHNSKEGFIQTVLKYRAEPEFVGKLYSDVIDQTADDVESVVDGQKEYEQKKLGGD